MFEDLQSDLRERWLPSERQMKLADALLQAGMDEGRPDGNRGVYTAHLLINKVFGFWTADVEVVPLDGVFLTRDAVLDFVQYQAMKRNEETGEKLCGGYAWHPRVGEAAVWDDISSEYP